MTRVKFLLSLVLIFNYLNGIQSTEYLMCGFKHLTMAELTDMMTAFRDACQARFPASDDAIDGMNFGKFPDDKDLKCYVNCLLESMRMVRRGKFMTDLAIKNIKMFLPPGEMQDEWLRGIAACKDTGDDIKDACERTYSMVECFARNNDQFMFP